MATIPIFADVDLDNINQSAICAVATAINGSITSIDGRTLANVTNMPSSSNWTGVSSGVILGEFLSLLLFLRQRTLPQILGTMLLG
jgi:hypothetical protein